MRSERGERRLCAAGEVSEEHILFECKQVRREEDWLIRETTYVDEWSTRTQSTQGDETASDTMEHWEDDSGNGEMEQSTLEEGCWRERSHAERALREGREEEAPREPAAGEEDEEMDGNWSGLSFAGLFPEGEWMEQTQYEDAARRHGKRWATGLI